MDFNHEMFSELYALRDQFKEAGRHSQGRAPIVCSDEALISIAERCPRKLSDFESIQGIGKTFITQYGFAFLEVIQKHEAVSTEKSVAITSITGNLLRELEKKLVNLNRRNRLLYMPKIINKYAFDLYGSSTQDVRSILFHPEKSILVCDASNDAPEALSKHKKIVSLLREVNKDLRDKGQNDLYIGYPFVIGRLQGENFDVCAPLALFPITAERTSAGITLQLDASRDTVYNTTLILAYFKFNNLSTSLPPDTIEDVSMEKFLTQVIEYYQDSGIKIAVKNEGVCAFKNYISDEFPAFRSGEMYLHEHVVLGKYPIYSNSIQKDFGSILSSGEINSLIERLLLNSEDIDYYSDTYSGENEIKIKDVPLEISEQKLVYINELNSSQEAVLAAIDKLDELVIQGPPGTGKSQTITNLIAEYVYAGKTVLMVSEKKTALDVVHSRLGPLSNYTLLIDDVANKNLFYDQLYHMLSTSPKPKSEQINFDENAKNIDVLVDRLKKIADKLYKPDTFGIEPYKVYLKCRKIELADIEQRQRAKAIHNTLSKKILQLHYATLSGIHDHFSKLELSEKLASYTEIIATYPWITSVKAGINTYDLMQIEDRLQDLVADIKEFSQKNFILRFFKKGAIKQHIKEVASLFFTEVTDQTIGLFLKDCEAIHTGLLSHYESVQQLSPLFYRSTEDEREYLKLLVSIKKLCHDSLLEANDELYNQILSEHIMTFEVKNQELFRDIDSFDHIIQTLSNSIANKKSLTRKKLEQILLDSMKHLQVSKREGEIRRQLESKRRWSVNKFVSKFDFELFKAVKVWLLTPEVVSEIIPLQKGLFDLVIFDEASQMYVEKGIPSILRAKKVVIAGDHKQLRPSSLGAGRIEMDDETIPEDMDIPAALDEESLLDLARFKYRDVLLNFHYRSKYEELIAFSNYAFYHGQLYVSPNATQPDRPPIEVHKLENAVWRNRSNLEEARKVLCLLKAFFAERQDDSTIGIITFNSNQRDLIDDLIDEECAIDASFATAVRAELGRKKDGEDIGLFVKNIESVQGDERDTIIFSIGYAKNENGRLIRNFGWLNQKGGENRLNVAISRAKQKVHIVTSFDPSELQVEDTKNDGPKFLKKYLEYSFAISESDSDRAQQILHSFGDDKNTGENISFDSDFEIQVYDALRNRGYDVDTQVGIGGYSIDLAVKKNGEYILGIECDGRLYHSSKSARERDYHRQKYLESRGWRIHRIWSTNWWKNPKGEIEKICVLLDALNGAGD